MIACNNSWNYKKKIICVFYTVYFIYHLYSEAKKRKFSDCYLIVQFNHSLHSCLRKQLIVILLLNKMKKFIDFYF